MSSMCTSSSFFLPPSLPTFLPSFSLLSFPPCASPPQPVAEEAGDETSLLGMPVSFWVAPSQMGPSGSRKGRLDL